MRVEGLRQPPLQTSLMGVVRGAADHNGLAASTPWLYGASGHAFLVNVHPELCPSGPYCWKAEGFDRLLANVGLRRRDLGFFTAASASRDREAAEGAVREALAAGQACAFMNMDHQLITGCDERGFFLAEPWGECAHTPTRLTSKTWEELGDEIHANVYVFERTQPADPAVAVRESLDYALDLYAQPARHAFEGYGIGPEAWTHWVWAVEHGCGDTHGAWWNAMVWSECRTMAGAYLEEIAECFPDAAPIARELATRYAAIGASLHNAGDRTMATAAKVALLEASAANEREAVAGLRALRRALDAI